MKRCRWADPNSELYIAYHDREWGRLEHDDQKLFEMLILEGFQAGLSWLTILKKREAFRRAFDRFDPAAVAQYGPEKVESLMADVGIVRNRRKILASIQNAKIFLGCALLPAGMILVITSNLSSAIIICGIVFIMSFVVYPNYRLHGFLTALIAIGYVGIREWLKKAVEAGTQMKGSFRLTRLFVWINPEKYIDDKGYQTMQGLYAIGSGGLFGKGLGKSMQKLGFIPESQNDMIFSIICEELGLFGAICVILLFIIMLWRIIYISQNSPDLFGSLLAVGVFAHIAIQVIINIAVVTNVFPNTGVTLPFISYGGSATILLLAELGIVFNISSQINLER